MALSFSGERRAFLMSRSAHLLFSGVSRRGSPCSLFPHFATARERREEGPAMPLWDRLQLQVPFDFTPLIKTFLLSSCSSITIDLRENRDNWKLQNDFLKEFSHHQKLVISLYRKYPVFSGPIISYFLLLEEEGTLSYDMCISVG